MNLQTIFYENSIEFHREVNTHYSNIGGEYRVNICHE